MAKPLRHPYKLAILTAGLAASCLPTPNAQGQSSEALMEVLVRKGILTEQEAEDIKADLARENANVNKVNAPGSTTSRLDIYGDFRGRFEGFYSSHEDFVTRNRFRYRARLGINAALTENIEAGFRIGSGDLDGGIASGIDPISQNQTFQNNASKKGVFIDLAYGRWRTDPRHLDYSGSVTVGKMENPFVFSSLIFDGDYTPEGIATKWTYRFNREQSVSFNAGGFVVDEIGAETDDPYLLGAQVRYDAIWKQNAASKPKLATTAGLAFLTVTAVENLSSTSIPNIQIGNERAGGTNAPPAAKFNPIVADASMTYWLDSFPFYNGFFPIKIGADYLYNPAVSHNNQAFAAGVTFGKAGKKATWDLSYEYRFLESDAWFEEFVDSDFGAFYSTALPNSAQGTGYRAGTNIKGNIVRLNYSPLNALTFGVSWFNGRVIDRPAGASGTSTMNRVQVDAVVKF